VWQPVLKHVFYAVIAILVVAPPALRSTGWFTRLLSSRPVVWFGEISYEVFLLHVIAMWVAMSFVLGWQPFTGSMTVLMVVSLAITIPLAWLLHRATRRKVRPCKQIDLFKEPAGDSASVCTEPRRCVCARHGSTPTSSVGGTLTTLKPVNP
jgi:peptidoglycan/LPS O-acetylase OafA/YrhL